MAFDLEQVEYICQHAKAIAFDTCHKIYIIGDETELEKMRGYGYEMIITNEEMNPAELAGMVHSWYRNSCGLRFVEFVNTNADTGDTDFETIIGQGEDPDEEDEE
jgi:hypothetical protein